MPLVVAGALVLALGCRSSTQTDVVQREMRHQEDQIYALQDYLAEYQQLLCEARTENASLRQQVVRDQFRDGEPGERDRQPTPPSRAPSAPSGKPESEIKIDDNIEMTLPEAPPLEIDTPEPPPLDATSRDVEPTDAKELQVTFEEQVDAPPAEAGSPEVVNASHDEVEPVEAAPLAAVAVRAEVSLDAEANGPRVLVDVLPLTADGTPAALDGDLSLMFLDPEATDNSKVLARWDFAADELAPFARETSHGPTFVFPLQLPAGLPTDRPVELWVRAVPTNGEKVLSHASLELTRPGRVVVDERIRPKKIKYPVRTAAAEMPLASSRISTPKPGTVTNTDGWQVARPGDIQDESQRSAENGGTWRTATQPIPLVESRPVGSDPLDSYERDERYRLEPDVQRDPREVPKWLPERPRAASPPVDHILAPPKWSAKR